MKFHVKYLKEEAQGIPTPQVMIVESDWENIVMDALKNKEVYQVVGVEIDRKHWHPYNLEV